MNIALKYCVIFLSAVVVLLLPACRPRGTGPTRGTPATQPAATNRIQAGTQVVNNLGITFATVTKGRLGVWRTIPGLIEVPEAKRWLLRAPARGRVLSLAPRWQRVERGDAVATVVSSALPEAQRMLSLTLSLTRRAADELVAARARLVESEAQLRDALGYEAAVKRRLEEVQSQPGSGNALLVRETLEMRRAVTEAARAALDAAIVRDDLQAKVAAKTSDLEQARLSFAEQVQSLSVLTGLPPQELTKTTGDTFTWQTLGVLTIHAPASGTVVELSTNPGESIEHAAPMLRLFDVREVRFRGQIPEGDLGELAAGNVVRIEFPSRRLPPIETTLGSLLPVADATTRMLLVDCPVPNPGDALAHGISALARVRVRESPHEELLVPLRCVVFDGLDAIVFRRDPQEPDVLVRTPVELGARTADQVEVLAGVQQGDALVADGVHQLKQTGLGKPPQGGHFHADGTWHGDHK